MSSPPEGWYWPPNARKAHYYRDGSSLCRNWAILVSPSDDTGAGGGPDDCKRCAKKRGREIAKAK